MSVWKYCAPIVALFLLSNSDPAFSSSEDAWVEFREDVKLKCLQAAASHIQSMPVHDIQVDPFGSENFGFSLITLEDPTEKTYTSIVCAYDKKAGTAEISTLFH